MEYMAQEPFVCKSDFALYCSRHRVRGFHLICTHPFTLGVPLVIWAGQFAHLYVVLVRCFSPLGDSVSRAYYVIWTRTGAAGSYASRVAPGSVGEGSHRPCVSVP